MTLTTTMEHLVPFYLVLGLDAPTLDPSLRMSLGHNVDVQTDCVNLPKDSFGNRQNLIKLLGRLAGDGSQIDEEEIVFTSQSLWLEQQQVLSVFY